MEATTLLYGTQNQFLDTINHNRSTRKSSSAFIISEILNWDIDFTLLITLYHAIGLLAQHRIISEGYSHFSDFYLQNTWFLPVLVTLNQSLNERLEKDTYYQHSDDNNIRTYPYSKINVLWVVDTWSVISTTSITIQDILDVEKIVWAVPKTKTRERFFIKSTSTKPKINLNWTLDNFDLIDSSYIYRFLENLKQQVKLILPK